MNQYPLLHFHTIDKVLWSNKKLTLFGHKWNQGPLLLSAKLDFQYIFVYFCSRKNLFFLCWSLILTLEEYPKWHPKLEEEQTAKSYRIRVLNVTWPWRAPIVFLSIKKFQNHCCWRHGEECTNKYPLRRFSKTMIWVPDNPFTFFKMHCHLILQAAAIFNAQSLRLGRGLGRHVVVFYIENLEAPLGYGSKFPMSQPLTRLWHGPFMGSK